MRIAQVLLANASLYEKKAQQIDFAALAAEHDVITVARTAEIGNADVAHVYGRQAHVFKPTSRRWFTRPRTVAVAPIERDGFELLPEAVEDNFFETRRPATGERQPIVASFDRPSLRSIVAQTHARLARTREDLQWMTFDAPPTPDEFGAVGVWIDPAIDELDYDGLVAAGVVAGLPVVASRTPINVQRLEKGRTGFLVPPNDPNELTHAILTALFKPEVAQQKIESALQTLAKFRPRQRARVLLSIYHSLSS